MKRKHLTKTPVCPQERLVIISNTTGCPLLYKGLGHSQKLLLLPFIYSYFIYLHYQIPLKTRLLVFTVIPWSKLLVNAFCSSLGSTLLFIESTTIRPWYVHFASLFCIIIYCYSLIYFIFRDDTYGISSVFTCWWSLEELLPESGFCWKKDHQGTIFWRSGKFQKNARTLYFTKRLRKPEGGVERSQGQPHAQGAWPGPWPRRPCVRALWPTLALAPSRTSSSPKT
jgi:hypothetical protein